MVDLFGKTIKTKFKGNYRPPAQTANDAQQFAEINNLILKCKSYIIANATSAAYVDIANANLRLKDLRKQAKAMNSKFRVKRDVN